MLACIARIKRVPIFHSRNLFPMVRTSFGERRCMSQFNPINTQQRPLLERNPINELKKYGIHIPQIKDYSVEFLPFSAGIGESDSASLMIMKLSEGHKPTEEILEYVYSKSSEIDPSVSPEFVLMRLNNLGICGENIAKLFNICGKNEVNFMALIRADQLKLISETFIYETIHTERFPDFIGLDDILKSVQKQLCGYFNDSSKQTVKE